MSDNISKSFVLPVIGEVKDSTASLPVPLPGETRRQAVDSTYGDAYQAWWSIDAWLRLTDADEVVYLEGAEDFDIVKNDGAIAVQVKRNAGTISLGTIKAHEALENFWVLSNKEFNRHIEFHFLTTSSVAMEKDGIFGATKGIDAWRAAQTNIDLAVDVTRYLLTKLADGSQLKLFLNSADPLHIQEQLIKKFHWLTDQPDIDAVKRSVDNRITILLNDQRRPLSLVQNVRKFLESRFWEIMLERSSGNRCLTRGELLLQVEAATTVSIPIPIDQFPELFSNMRPGWELLNLLLQKSTRPPEPLLKRPELTQRLEELVKHRKVVLLTGTVYKGKTTVAQLVSSALCPEAWWVKLTGLKSDQVDIVLSALSLRIENGDCPSLIVIDDLDISPAAHRVYRDSLSMALHRATSSGRGVILTAQGGSSDSAIMQDFSNLELLDVPELSTDDASALCIEHGCSREIAALWGSLITAWTRGHPKLVQVRLAELVIRDWPSPTSNDLLAQSAAVNSTRQIARQLLCDSSPPQVTELIYLISECLVPMHRSVCISLAETVDGLTNGGDIIDNLAGKWLERLDCEYFRTTALLSGVAKDVWSPEKYKVAHIRLHDAILTKRVLDPSEAAALLYHAFIGGEPRRLARTSLRLQLISSNEAKREVERQLLWLPFVALDSEQYITDDAMAGAVLRGLQFRVAYTLDSECLPKICNRWAEDVERIPHSDARAANRAMMLLSIGFSDSPKVPLKPRLDAILGTLSLPSEIIDLQTGFGEQFFLSANVGDGLPNSGTTAQSIFLCATRCVRDLDNLNELLKWLDIVATDDIRQQFDTMLAWPLVQDLGAFVLGAFAAIHERTENWEPWLDLLGRVNEYAVRQNSPRFGQEAAKTKAIILTEYLSRSEDALRVLENADVTFGPSPVLVEQRANVLFQTNDDESMLEVWNQLTSNPTSKATLDPYAYRRAGMSAARLKQWEKAGQIFLEGADSIKPGSLELTKFGLCVDAALAISLGGNQSAAAILLSDAVLSLPAEANMDGNEHWEALQRVAVAVCSTIENSVWKPTAEIKLPFTCGYASSPGLKFAKAESVQQSDPGQAARSELTRAQVLRLVSTLTKYRDKIAEELEVLSGSKYFYVRWVVNEARLSLHFSTGAGCGFIEALLAFDRSTNELVTKQQQAASLLEPDDGQLFTIPVTPERWFALLCVGVICSGPELVAHLKIWLHDSIQHLGEDAVLTNQIRLLLKGASQPPKFVKDTASPLTARFGAVTRLLCSGLTAKETLQAQAFLISALMRDETSARQQIYNRHIARYFAGSWRAHAQNRFQFYNPSKSVPELLTTLDGLERGDSTLRSVLITASSALREPLGPFIEQVM